MEEDGEVCEWRKMLECVDGGRCWSVWMEEDETGKKVLDGSGWEMVDERKRWWFIVVVLQYHGG